MFLDISFMQCLVLFWKEENGHAEGKGSSGEARRMESKRIAFGDRNRAPRLDNGDAKIIFLFSSLAVHTKTRHLENPGITLSFLKFIILVPIYARSANQVEVTGADVPCM